MSPEGVAKAAKMCLACSKEFSAEINNCPDDGTALIALNREDPWLGKVIADRFECLEIIGKGGMGVVYLARHQMMDRLVALKMLQAELTQDELSVKRFQQEAKAASQLNHPHLITMHDFGVLPPGNQPFLVMEYLEGESLLDVMRGDGPLEPKRAVKIFTEVAEGLNHAHKVGVLHRDLKPSNIILINHQGDHDFVKVVDFGLAKLMPWSGKESQHLTKTGEVFGSPIYMSPEQCMGKELRETSDVYSLGITLFEALTGKPPFRGSNSIQTASKHMTEAPPRFADVRPDLPLPHGLENVVMKCLAKDPKNRFQSMAEFADALQAGLHSESVEMPASLMVSTRAIPAISAQVAAAQSAVRRAAEPIPAPEPEPRKPLPIKWIAAGVGLLLVIGGGVWAALPQTGSASGIITFYDTDHLHLKRNGELSVFQINKSRPPNLKEHASESALGSQANIEYTYSNFGNNKTGDVQKVLLGKADDGAQFAINAVDEFLMAVTDRNKDAVQEYYKNSPGLADFAKDYGGDSTKFYYLHQEDNNMLHGQLGFSSGQLPKRNPNDVDYGQRARVTGAYKLEKLGDKYTVLVDASHFCVDSKDHWKFEVEPTTDRYKLISFQKIDNKQWDRI